MADPSIRSKSSNVNAAVTAGAANDSLRDGGGASGVTVVATTGGSGGDDTSGGCIRDSTAAGGAGGARIPCRDVDQDRGFTASGPRTSIKHDKAAQEPRARDEWQVSSMSARGRRPADSSSSREGRERKEREGVSPCGTGRVEVVSARLIVVAAFLARYLARLRFFLLAASLLTPALDSGASSGRVVVSAGASMGRAEGSPSSIIAPGSKSPTVSMMIPVFDKIKHITSESRIRKSSLTVRDESSMLNSVPPLDRQQEP